MRLTPTTPKVVLRELHASREALGALLNEPVRTIRYPWAQRDRFRLRFRH